MHWYRNLTPSCWCGLMRLHLRDNRYMAKGDSAFRPVSACIVLVSHVCAVACFAHVDTVPAEIRVDDNSHDRLSLRILALAVRPLRLVQHDGVSGVGIVEGLHSLLSYLCQTHEVNT